MSRHPDADALMRAILERPTDETPRLVLADWLDDTGRPADAAWAGYIRARCAAARIPADAVLRNELLHEAANRSHSVVATLSIGAAHLVRHAPTFIDLLPADRFTARLDGVGLPLAVVELVPESVARTNRVIPLVVSGSVLYLAADPTDPEMLQRLEFILNRDIVSIRASADEIDRAIEAHYPWVNYESVTEELLIFPEDPWPSGWAASAEAMPVVQLVNLILTDAIRFDAGWVEITPEPEAAQVQYRVEDEWVTQHALPRRLLGPVVARLAEMAEIPAAPDGSVSGDGVIPIQFGPVRTAFNVMVVPLAPGPWVWIERVADPVAVA